MENQLQIFSNPDFGDIRAIEIDGSPFSSAEILLPLSAIPTRQKHFKTTYPTSSNASSTLKLFNKWRHKKKVTNQNVLSMARFSTKMQWAAFSV